MGTLPLPELEIGKPSSPSPSLRSVPTQLPSRPSQPPLVPLLTPTSTSRSVSGASTRRTPQTALTSRSDGAAQLTKTSNATMRVTNGPNGLIEMIQLERVTTKLTEEEMCIT